jgi:hypothetical protein
MKLAFSTCGYQVRGEELILLRLRYGGMNLQALLLHLG